MRSSRLSLLLLAGVLGFAACSAEAQPVEEDLTLFIVRHAEKADDGIDDPSLTAEGQARAELLAQMLRDAGIDAVYATRYRRAQDTAVPLAEALDLPVTTYEVQGTALADTLLARHRGEHLFVVGHSNTVPMLLNVLVGEERYPQLGEQDYDALFVVTVHARGEAEVALLRVEP